MQLQSLANFERPIEKFRQLSRKFRSWIDNMAQSDATKTLKNLNYEVCHQPWSHKYNKDTTAIKDYNCLLLAVIDIFTLFVTATLNKKIQPDLMSCSNRAVTKFGTP